MGPGIEPKTFRTESDERNNRANRAITRSADMQARQQVRGNRIDFIISTIQKLIKCLMAA